MANPAEMESPILPTTVVGSHGIPGWLHAARAGIAAGEFGPTDIEETYRDASRLAILDQLEAGIDVVSDGEMRRLHFVEGFYGQLDGLQRLGPRRKLGSAGYDQVPRYQAVGRVSATGGLGIVAEFASARTLTAAPLKIACPGPLMFTLAVDLGQTSPYGSRLDLAEEFAEIINRELQSLVRAGATFIQIDDPSFSWLSQVDTEEAGGVPVTEMVRLINRAVEGVHGTAGVRVALHLCFGNFRGRSRTSPRSYRSLFPAILAASVDQFVLEFAGRELADLEILQDLPADREVGAGVVDVKSFYAERVEDISDRIRSVLKYVSPERVWINPDCGFNHTPREVAVSRLHAMTSATRVVRRELTGGS